MDALWMVAGLYNDSLLDKLFMNVGLGDDGCSTVRSLVYQGYTC